MTDLEYAILDELYFVTSFSDIKEATLISISELTEMLIDLINRKYISQLVFDSSANDFKKLDEVDFSIFAKSYFVATKEGLLAHNVR